MKHLLTYRLFESEVVDNFEEKIKVARDILFHNHEISRGYEIFTKEMQRSGIETLNNLNTIYKKNKETANSMLDNTLNMLKTYSNSVKNTISATKQNDEWVQAKISELEKEKIDLESNNQAYAKKTFDENFKGLLDECKKNYSLLKDKDIVKRLDDLYNIVYKYYDSKKYSTAVDAASHLIVTFFPNKNFYWKNEWTDQKLSNEKTLKVIDEYKSKLNDASSIVYKKT
jgi:hypothetical protein